MSQENSGKGATKGYSVEHHNSTRREVKARQRAHRAKADTSLVGTTLFGRINQDRAERRRQEIENTMAIALELFEEYSNSTFVQTDGRRARYSTDTRLAGLALMRYLFTGNQEDLLEAKSLQDSERQWVRLHFVLVCLQERLKDAYGQRAAWYNDVRNTTMVRRGVSSFNRISV